jgi:hypothetical protein
MVNGWRAEYLAENLLLKLEIDGRGAPDLSPLVPKVILENNRHIIPADLFTHQQRPRTADASINRARLNTSRRTCS